MEEQRERARAAQKKGDPAEGALAELAGVVGPTEFVGYERLHDEGRIVGMVSGDAVSEAAGEGTAVRLLLDRSPFYAEGGGQIGDAGTIRTAGGGVVEVTDTRPGPGGTIVHRGRVVSGEVRQGEPASGEVDQDRRAATARSHTGTHVLHHTIRLTLGEHARQAGSLVAPGRLRFDFTHYEAVPNDTLEEIEYLVNRRLADDQPVRAYETTYDFARSEGAIALFGEKYGDLVRVVEVGDYSVELCGGTHVRHTGEVALIRLVSEASIGSGFRRVEAVTGPDALRQINLERRLLEEVVEAVGGGDPNAAPERVRQAVARIKALESELGVLRRGERDVEVERLAGKAQDVAGVALVLSRLDGTPAGELREIALALKDRLESRTLGAVVLGAVADGKAVLVGSCTNELVARGVSAPALLEPAARAIGGNAGGRPTIASGGGPNGGAFDAALDLIPARLADLLQAA
jgi:alanyl-tRNA synthetase